jgi:hypothetical protein
MKSFDLFMETTVVSSKSELQALIIDLDTIRQNIIKVQEAIPNSPGDMKIKQRLTIAHEKCILCIALIQSAL